MRLMLDITLPAETVASFLATLRTCGVQARAIYAPELSTKQVEALLRTLDPPLPPIIASPFAP